MGGNGKEPEPGFCVEIGPRFENSRLCRGVVIVAPLLLWRAGLRGVGVGGRHAIVLFFVRSSGAQVPFLPSLGYCLIRVESGRVEVGSKGIKSDRQCNSIQCNAVRPSSVQSQSNPVRSSVAAQQSNESARQAVNQSVQDCRPLLARAISARPL